jgi:hypothetical protein
MYVISSILLSRALNVLEFWRAADLTKKHWPSKTFNALDNKFEDIRCTLALNSSKLNLPFKSYSDSFRYTLQ